MAYSSVEWNSGLLDCCDSVTTCCYGFWCCPCLACSVSAQFGENRCFPLCDIFSPAITSAIGLPLCAPPAGLSLRVGIRNRYNIKGSACKDVATSCFCSWCSWCQMHRELKHRKENNAVVVNMQPPPVMMSPGYPNQQGY
ncbi:cornifelin homolog B-like [Pseudoliparis swirei]|uniref:cornifelin homolog B-like n=1 Tax=Pseudoliparis swirei TaxID=2059687 RepID=UPI0024BE2FA6|nr:cornifelin homolog B-like [Pseudoliparis swirei]XP_056271226.1 cornifelin homolog B-like [Pseudoliparis swirei]XP_056271227.1 cornifelin homolog B-like [Pseudoliparis swirei]